MTIPHHFVCRIKAPNEILQHGYCDFAGQFDINEFEQVQGPLPENYLLINHNDLINTGSGLRTKTLLEKWIGRK